MEAADRFMLIYFLLCLVSATEALAPGCRGSSSTSSRGRAWSPPGRQRWGCWWYAHSPGHSRRTRSRGWGPSPAPPPAARSRRRSLATRRGPPPARWRSAPRGTAGRWSSGWTCNAARCARCGPRWARAARRAARTARPRRAARRRTRR